MKIGIAIEETWAFFHEIYADLSEHHETSLYEPKIRNTPVLKERLNRYYSRRDMAAFLRNQQVVFFEWASRLLAQASHMPKTCGLVTRLHRYEMYHWLDQVRWEAVDRVIVVSEAKRREFARRLPDQADKLVVIPEAISLKRFHPHPKPFQGNIGILCHLTPRKRVYELILAFYELSQRRQQLHLHIGGGEHPRFRDYYQALRSLVSDLDLEQRVTFHGNQEDPTGWYRGIDIFVSNSYSEGLQLSPMEAVASGCYCLSHRWEGAEELLPEENLFYTERDFIRLVEAYLDLSEAEKQQRICALQERVTGQFDMDRTKVRIRELVESVGADYPPRAGSAG